MENSSDQCFSSKSHVSRIEEKFVRKKSRYRNRQDDVFEQPWPTSPQAFWAHSTVSVSGFATGRPNMYLYMTYLTKILWFCRLPPHLKGAKIRWRQFKFSLELTLVYELAHLQPVSGRSAWVRLPLGAQKVVSVSEYFLSVSPLFALYPSHQSIYH